MKRPSHPTLALFQIKGPRGRQRALVVGVTIVGILALLASMVWVRAFPKAGELSRQLPSSDSALIAEQTEVPPNLLRLVAPEEALELNATRPFSTRPDQPAAKFQIQKAREADVARAIACLAQAIYYEAGGEGPDGERAVAQVVLNRVRHPGFPASICGTVYQGSERTTGCQFTFTCDGSLRQLPIGSLWIRAQRLARDAIVSGQVFGPVGHATHYHADYVLPYWADSLDKQIQVGRHIFYRLKGGPGTARAFSQRYSAAEPLPPSPTAAEVAAEAIEQAVEGQNPAPVDLAALLADKRPESPLPARSPLKADEGVGSLITPFSSTTRVVAPKDDDCSIDEGERQIKPTSATNLRAGANAGGC